MLAFVWAPVALVVLSLGLGLLLEAVLRTRLPAALVAPAGLAALIALVMPLYRLGSGFELPLGLSIAAALAGFVAAGRGLRGRGRPGPAGAAALVAYLVYLAPVALSGHWTWAGYNFVNDTSSNFVWADLLARQGVTAPATLESTTDTIGAAPVRLGYPLGAHGLLATLRPLVGIDVSAIYQPVIALAAAMAALAMTELARAAGLRSWPAAAAGLLPLGAVLVYRYSLHGGIKELLVVALVATAAALARHLLDGALSLRLVVPIVLSAAALLHVFSAVGAAYALLIGVLVLAVALVERRSAQRVARLALAGAALATAAVAVNLSDVRTFADHAGEAFASEGGASTAYMGHLLRPIPLVQTAGAWFVRDYRVPVAPQYEPVNGVVIALIGVLLVVGIVVELRRRRPAGLLFFVPAALLAAALVPRLSPYAGAKLLVVLSPAVVLMAAIGGLELVRAGSRLARAAGAVGLVALVIGVATSVGLGYREVTLAPPDRIAAMEDAAANARGGGVWLVNEWEEFAKYFMREIEVNAAFEAESPRPAELRQPGPLFGRYYDLDALTLRYVSSFQGIIKRRSPVASRPPAMFELIHTNDYYEVWRRRPAVRVARHLPLQRAYDRASQPSCRAVRALAAAARPGDRIVAAGRSPLVLLPTASPSLRPEGWEVITPGVVVPFVPGQVEARTRTPAGPFRVWVRGSFGRATEARIDGRVVGAVEGINTPGQWLSAGQVRLTAGTHRLGLRRPGFGPEPGNSWRGEIGPLALEPLGAPRTRSFPASATRRLCNGAWDWIELVRG